MDKAAEAAMLTRIRALVAAHDGHAWELGSEGDGMILAAAGRDGSNVIVARFSAHATIDEMQLSSGALDYCRFLLSLVDRAIVAMKAAEQREPEPEARRAPNYSAEAAMLCGSPAFKKFLMERHGLESPATDERVAQKLRSILGVTSRRQINESEAVRDRWVRLRADFNFWKGRDVV